MRTFLSIFVFYWAFGMFLLPMGDFAALNNLPEQYRHCKETEDKDMTLVDFITDHLINIDAAFDKHDNGDKQKPHNNNNYTHHHSFVALAVTAQIHFSIKPIFDYSKIAYNFSKKNNYTFHFNSSIFHPPLV
jgi:hypothetical protein